MTESATPAGVHDIPRETTFERLCRAAYDTMAAHIAEQGEGSMIEALDEDRCGPVFIDGTCRMPEVIRAVLTELRKITGELPSGYISVNDAMTAEQADALRKHWAEMNDGWTEMALPGATFTPVAQWTAEFIDAILAEVGGSGG